MLFWMCKAVLRESALDKASSEVDGERVCRERVRGNGVSGD